MIFVDFRPTQLKLPMIMSNINSEIKGIMNPANGTAHPCVSNQQIFVVNDMKIIVIGLDFGSNNKKFVASWYKDEDGNVEIIDIPKNLKTFEDKAIYLLNLGKFFDAKIILVFEASTTTSFGVNEKIFEERIMEGFEDWQVQTLDCRAVNNYRQTHKEFEELPTKTKDKDTNKKNERINDETASRIILMLSVPPIGSFDKNFKGKRLKIWKPVHDLLKEFRTRKYYYGLIEGEGELRTQLNEECLLNKYKSVRPMDRDKYQNEEANFLMSTAIPFKDLPEDFRFYFSNGLKTKVDYERSYIIPFLQAMFEHHKNDIKRFEKIIGLNEKKCHYRRQILIEWMMIIAKKDNEELLSKIRRPKEQGWKALQSHPDFDVVRKVALQKAKKLIRGMFHMMCAYQKGLYNINKWKVINKNKGILNPANGTRRPCFC